MRGAWNKPTRNAPNSRSLASNRGGRDRIDRRVGGGRPRSRHGRGHETTQRRSRRKSRAQACSGTTRGLRRLPREAQRGWPARASATCNSVCDLQKRLRPTKESATYKRICDLKKKASGQDQTRGEDKVGCPRMVLLGRGASGGCQHLADSQRIRFCAHWFQANFDHDYGFL